MSPQCQSTLFFDNGGQPGHRQAWLNSRTNQNCRNFFLNTLETLDNSYMRPRYYGYTHFQDNGCQVLYDFLLDKMSGRETIVKINKIYKESLAQHRP
jgi:multiple sugar transport system substrate-binding protein